MTFRIALCLALAFVLGPRASGQGQMKVSELSNFCASNAAGSKEACRFYIYGVTEGASIGAGVAHDKGHFCIPAGISMTNMTNTVRERIKADLAAFPDDKDLPAVSFVSAVMIKAYPCESAEDDASKEEISDLVGKAGEYITSYQQTFSNAKSSLAKGPSPGFYDTAIDLSRKASGTAAAIAKSGVSGYSLVALISQLDDMSLNAARASASTMIVAVRENKAARKNHALQDFQDLAQAEKNCYDISGLLLQATLRYIASEEKTLGTAH